VNQGYNDAQSNIEGQIASRAYELQQQAEQLALQEGALTANYKGARTLAGQQLDYGMTRDKVADDQWAQTFAEDKRRYGDEFAYNKARDSITDSQWKQQFSEDVRRYGLDYGLQQQQMRQSASNSTADRSLSRERFEYDKTQDKIRQDEALKQSSSEKMSTEKQGLANAYRTGKLTPDQARKQIIEDKKLGFYTQAEAKEMNDALNILTGMSDQTSDPLQFYSSGGVLNQLK
jgi:hypothetical protein